jgi:FeS assembly SUF system protein
MPHFPLKLSGYYLPTSIQIIHKLVMSIIDRLPKNYHFLMETNLMILEERIVKMLRLVFDPEIPVNVYDLGLIYNVDIDEDKKVKILMTLTAPNCPAADFIVEDVRIKVEGIDEVTSVEVELTFDPTWDKDMMSEEAKLDLGFL